MSEQRKGIEFLGLNVEVGIPTLDKWRERLVPGINSVEDALKEEIVKKTIMDLATKPLLELSEREKIILEKVTLSNGSAKSLEEIGGSLDSPISSAKIQKTYYELIKRIEAFRVGAHIPTKQEIAAKARIAYEKKHQRRKERETSRGAAKNSEQEAVDNLKSEIGIQIEQELWEADRKIYNQVFINSSEEQKREAYKKINILTKYLFDNLSETQKQSFLNIFKKDKEGSFRDWIKSYIKEKGIIIELIKIISV